MTTDRGAGRTPDLVRLAQPPLRPLSAADLVMVALLGVLLWVGVRLGAAVPEILQAREISPGPEVLPEYAAWSGAGMLAASLVWGTLAATLSLRPWLDVLQGVPLLPFLPVAPAAISPIFTRPARNLSFAQYGASPLFAASRRPDRGPGAPPAVGHPRVSFTSPYRRGRPPSSGAALHLGPAEASPAGPLTRDGVQKAQGPEFPETVISRARDAQMRACGDPSGITHLNPGAAAPL